MHQPKHERICGELIDYFYLYVVKVLKTAPFSFADAITLNAITLKRNSAMRKPKLSPFMWFRFFFTACNAGLGV